MSTALSQAQSAQQGNRTIDGKYTFGTHAEPAGLALSEHAAVFLSQEEFDDESHDSPRRREMVEKLRTFIPEKTDLYYVAYDEQLSKDQMMMMLAGDASAAYDDYDESAGDYRYDQAREEVADALRTAQLRHETDIAIEDLSSDEADELIQLALENDQSDPIKDLSRNTSPQLMRARLSAPDWQKDLGNAWSGHSIYGTSENDETKALEQSRYQAIENVLKASGIDTADPENQEAIRDLVSEGPYDWHESVDLDIIFAADIENASASHEGETALEFTNPHVVLIDRNNGSGYDAQFKGAAKKTIPAAENINSKTDRVFLDKGDIGGYGWDEVCGLVTSAYKTDVNREVKSKEGDNE